MVDLEFLRTVDVLEGLDDEQLGVICENCLEKSFRKDAKIFSRGDTALHLCIVKQGRVDLRINLPGVPAALPDHTIASLTKAATFQWSSLVKPHLTRLSSYSASDLCEIVMIHRESLLNIFENDSRIGYTVMSNLAVIIGDRFTRLQEEASNYLGDEIINSVNW
ncbi:MAG: cyclic nucleotide-binding domain-containing protein [Deltaproteobacteria bacterium]|nr:cyclic nucleotide-binding domain-containing protein [Deltaproteobacteria bacterium]